VKQAAKPPPDPHFGVFVRGSGVDVRYSAALFRAGRLERSAGPFMTLDAAAAAFLPVAVWPRLEKPPR
jgi:hypothetical protein